MGARAGMRYSYWSARGAKCVANISAYTRRAETTGAAGGVAAAEARPNLRGARPLREIESRCRENPPRGSRARANHTPHGAVKAAGRRAAQSGGSEVGFAAPVAYIAAEGPSVRVLTGEWMQSAETDVCCANTRARAKGESYPRGSAGRAPSALLTVGGR